MKKSVLCLSLAGLLMGGCGAFSRPVEPAKPVAVTEPTSAAEKIVHVVDTVGLSVVEVLAIAGVPFVGLAASLWRSSRQKKLTANIVASVQAGRMAIGHNSDARRMFDDKVRPLQTPAVVAFVKKIKAAGLIKRA